MKTLKALIEFASQKSEDIFRKTGGLLPMYHAICEDKSHRIILQPDTDTKDEAVEIVKAAFAMLRVDRYCFMSEAWLLVGDPVKVDLAKIEREGLEWHPDRREVVSFLAENRRGERLTGCRFILRPEHGKATLSPLRLDKMENLTTEGRMVGLLLQREK
jgi:hypothetical protein